MKTITKLTSLVLALLMLISVFAAAPLTASAKIFSSGDYNYEVLDDDTASITWYKGSDAELTIPSELDGHTVTSIRYDAFSECKSLASVIIPDSVTSIGNRAFEYCLSLKSVNIPDGVTSIGSRAFYGTGNPSITIPASVTSIGNCAFDHYMNLIVDENNQNYSSSNGALYNKDKTKLIQYIGVNWGDSSFTIPDSVTDIGYNAFFSCSQLTSITIPNSVITIDSDAFSCCFNLKSITIPDSVTSIGNNAFYKCNDLTSVTIPDSVTSMGGEVFSECIGLKNVTIGNGVTSIGDKTFYKCTSLENVTIGNGVTNIGNGAFGDCTSLKSIRIPDSVTSIAYVFYGCTSLENVTFGKGISSIYNSYFAGCLKLSSFIVDDDNENYSSSDGVLYNKDKTELKNYPIGKPDKSFTIPDGVKSIGERAFERCTSLTSVTIPESVTKIGAYAFRDCENLENITFGNDIQGIYNYAFDGCTSLENVKVGKAVSEINIDSQVFNYCSNIIVDDENQNYSSLDGVLYNKDKTELIKYPPKKADASFTVPDSVTKIGASAFYGCTSLTGVTIPDSVTSIEYQTFYGCTNLESITVPDSVTSIDDKAFYQCTSLTSITIPDSVTSIGSYAFYDCKKLKNITLGNGITHISYDAFNGTAYYNAELNSDDDAIYLGKYLYKAKNTISGNYTVKNGTICILDSAFYSCSGLTGITIPDSVTRIGNTAFCKCSSLASVTIPDSVTSIEYQTFYGCTNLESITIPDSVTSIGEKAFIGCSSLTSVTIPDGITSIEAKTFSDCTSLESITIPDSVRSIGSMAFNGCTSLESITIPDSVTSIGEKAFYNCTSLENVTFGKGVTSIGAFDGCSKLSSFIVDDDNENYSSLDGVLYNKDKTELIKYPAGKADASFTVPDSVDTISAGAFKGCTSLTSVNISKYVISIGYGAFAGCDALTDIYYDGSKVKWLKITDEEDSWSNSKINVHYTNSEGEINNYLYKILDNNTIEITGYVGDKSDVTVPRKLEGCTVSSIASFGYNPGIKSLTVPDCVTSIGYEAFNGCNKLTNIKLPDSITSIGEDAFKGTAYQSNSKNWENGCLYIGHHLVAAYPKNGLCVVKNGTITIATCIYCPYEDKDTYSVVIPASVKHIGYHAFGYYYAEAYYDDPDMGIVEYYESHKVNLTVYGKKGTAAERFANDNEFTFKELTSISKCKVSGIKAKTYNGKAQTQSVTVKVGTKTLKKGTDYTISYKNNKNAGKATMTITATGFYTGSVKKTFKINKAKNPMKVTAKKTVTANSSQKTTIKKAVKVKKAQGKVTYKTNNKNVTVKNGTIIVAKGLTSGKTYKVKITVSAKGNKNYKSGKKVVTVKIKIK